VELRAGLSPANWSLGGCRSFERKGRSWRPVPPKAALLAAIVAFSAAESHADRAAMSQEKF